MLNAGTSMITPRKLEALVAVYLQEHPSYKGWVDPTLRVSNRRYGDAHPDRAGLPVLDHTSRMGGASWRMVEELQQHGYLTKQSHSPMYDEPKSNRLTVKGYNALIEHVGPKYEKLIDPQSWSRRKEERRKFEAARDIRFEQAKARRAEEERERVAKRNVEAVEKARAILGRKWAWQSPEQMTDEQVLDFVDRIASI